MKKIAAAVLGTCAVTMMLVRSAHDSGPQSSQWRSARRAYLQHLPHLRNRRYVLLIDYTKPIFMKRLWVIDMTTKQPVLSTYVTHAYRSGLIYATRFSNDQGSEKSSLGSYITQSVYTASYGRAMRLIGVDASNDHALERNIVVHTARYPFSRACFATAGRDNERIIELMKGGALVYVAR